MLIGIERRFIFVANSKSASTTVESLLAPFAEIVVGGEPALKHMLLRDALLRHADVFARPGQGPETFFKFGIMRDPVEWIHSWFRYRKGRRRKGGRKGPAIPADMTFRQFWERNDWTRRRGDGKRLQRDFFTDEGGAVLADVIIPHDALDAHLRTICAHLGIPLPPPAQDDPALPRRNVSRVTREDDPVPADMLDELRDFYAEDYALLARLPGINAEGLRRLAARTAGDAGAAAAARA